MESNVNELSTENNILKLQLQLKSKGIEYLKEHLKELKVLNNKTNKNLKY
jgi:hypothetical protein